MAENGQNGNQGNGDERRSYALERAVLDDSTRLPVLVWFGSSVFWLLLGSVLGLLAALKMHHPWLLADWSWLTFGRVRPAHLNLVAYGWASMAGVGTSLWLMTRLCRVALVYPRLLVVSAMIWNVGTGIGFVGILSGGSTSVEWLEFPPFAPPFLVVSLAIVSACGIATFRVRREPHVYVTQWYIFAALFWLPWLYTTAQLMIFLIPTAGVVQATTNWWFAHNVLGLWLTPIGLGTAYYIIPKVIGRPIYSYYLSILGFWSLALFYSWAGMHHLIGGPVPAWLVTASTVGSVMMFIPVIAVAVNHHLTMLGHFRHLRYSPSLRFVVFGAVAYTFVSFQGSIEALRDFNQVVHFTHYTVGHAHVGAYAFFSMVMFGAMYYIVPRLTGWEWGSAWAIRLHFWTNAVGIMIYAVSLTIGGWFQGLANDDPSMPFIRIVQGTVPYLVSRSLGGTLMTMGHLIFAGLFVMNLLRVGQRRGEPTYFRERQETSAITAPVGVTN